MLLLASSLREITATKSADAAVPVYEWHCVVPCLTTTASVKTLRQSSSLDSGIMSNFFLCSYRMSTNYTISKIVNHFSSHPQIYSSNILSVVYCTEVV